MALAVGHRSPVAIDLCNAIGAARVERGAVLLRDLLHQAVELTGAGLVDTGFLCQPLDPVRLQDPRSAQSIAVGGLFRAS
jgi:hypothetical protein